VIKQYGQAGMDRVLVAIANLLRRSLRLVDLVGRTNSDEFMIIAPHTDKPGAQALARRIQNTVQGAVMDMNGAQVQVKACVGVAVSENATLADNLALFARAEAALDRARREMEQSIILG